MKRKASILVSLVLILILIGLAHRTTVRYVDTYDASIDTDQSMRLIKLPVSLNIKGYKLNKISYVWKQHIWVCHYQPTGNPLNKVKSAKYIGVTFQPTTVPIIKGSQMDPFNLSRNYSFDSRKTGRDTLRILIGNSWNKLQVLNANYPAINVRDPSILKEKNRYYIIYTRGLISTLDFKHWQKYKWPAIPGFDYHQDWAPEFVTDKNGDHFVTMSVCKKGDSHHQLVITTFHNGLIGKHWNEIKGNLPSNVIDPNIQYYNGQYYLFCKNEKSKELLMGTSNNVKGPFLIRKVNIDSSKYDALEGPEALINHNKIMLMFDTYNLGKDDSATFGGLHYVERNLTGKTWSKMKTIQCPIVTRHGQIIRNK